MHLKEKNVIYSSKQAPGKLSGAGLNEFICCHHPQVFTKENNSNNNTEHAPRARQSTSRPVLHSKELLRILDYVQRLFQPHKKSKYFCRNM